MAEQVSVTKRYNPGEREQAKMRKLRVAAYCRVSTKSSEQETSYDTQVAAYTQDIRQNPQWELAGIYADFGMSGTQTERRPQFLQMIRDCEAGKIDMILCKSLSRFSRNTLDAVSYIKKLKALGVHIIFESNHVDTRAAYSEMLLTVLAAFAQEESRSISENTIWGIRKRFEEGVARWCRLYGYAKTEAGEYQIVPEQAAVVQNVFRLYEHGESIRGIAAFMTQHHIPSPNGAEKWSNSAVHTMLANERYAGDIVLQKFYVENHLSHKALRNLYSAEVPSYYIENHHTPIVSRRQFNRCQAIMAMRRVNGYAKTMDMGRCNQYPLGGKLRCPYCGSVLYQRSIPVQLEHRAGWCCEQGENPCRRFIIRSNLVEEALLAAYNSLNTAAVQGQLGSPDFAEAARLTLSMKGEYPAFRRVDFWWVDDLIDHIEFGAHSRTQRIPDDRVMIIYWRCGMVTRVSSGVQADRDNPAYVAELYLALLERRKGKEASA